MSAGTLYTVPEQVQGRRIQAVAAFGGVDIKLGEGYEHRVTNKTAEYLAKFPTGLIPSLETPEGAYIAESEAIAKYVATLAPNSTLLSTDAVTNATIDQWINFSTQEIFIPAKAAKTLTLGSRGLPYNKPIDTGYRTVVTEGLQKLDNYLATRTYLVGERITLADIHVASQLKYVFESIVDAAGRASLPNTVRFYNTIANHPKIAPSFGETAFVEKALQFTPPAKEKKEKAPKEAAPPKEKPAKAAAAAEEEEEPLVPAEPKVKNPLDDLPKSAFNLEDWKRAYSNMDTKGAGGSLEWFYEKFDKEGFSIWRVDFKYNDELTQTFMSSNQIGGFFNRLEASRKYLFGSMGVLGSTNDSIITGALILRGNDYKPVVDVAPDWESYSYAPIDLANADDKKFFEDALAWDLEIDGKKWADGKNFK